MLTFRPLGEDEAALFERFGPTPSSGVGARSRSFTDLLALGVYRPAWTWVALAPSGDVLARAAFSGPPDAECPWALDWFDLDDRPDRLEVATALLRTALAQLFPKDRGDPGGADLAYHLFLPADWRHRADGRADATDRILAVEAAGLRWFTERVDLRWTPTAGLPSRSARLRFVPVTDRATVLDVLERLVPGTLDAYAHHDVALHGSQRAAEITYDDLRHLPGGRTMWRLGLDHSGTLVGAVLPTRNPVSATIGYLGVLPELRGRGYVDDLIAEALHLFAAADETEVNDAVDLANAPALHALTRAGYRTVGHRVIMRRGRDNPAGETA
jgi:ribosomal protein S18 acetylase RimI-like enzyme